MSKRLNITRLHQHFFRGVIGELLLKEGSHYEKLNEFPLNSIPLYGTEFGEYSQAWFDILKEYKELTPQNAGKIFLMFNELQGDLVLQMEEQFRDDYSKIPSQASR